MDNIKEINWSLKPYSPVAKGEHGWMLLKVQEEIFENKNKKEFFLQIHFQN